MDSILNIIASVFSIFSTVFSQKPNKEQNININNSKIFNGNITQAGGDIVTKTEVHENEK